MNELFIYIENKAEHLWPGPCQFLLPSFVSKFYFNAVQRNTTLLTSFLLLFFFGGGGGIECLRHCLPYLKHAVVDKETLHSNLVYEIALSCAWCCLERPLHGHYNKHVLKTANNNNKLEKLCRCKIFAYFSYILFFPSSSLSVLFIVCHFV